MKIHPILLTVEQVRTIHKNSIARFGGAPDIRDEGLLESAVSMPGATFGGQYLHDGLVPMAAAYLFHICKNHAFVDGNKRAALASAETFLVLNGRRFVASEDELEQITLGVADGTIGKEALTKMLRKIIKKRKTDK